MPDYRTYTDEEGDDVEFTVFIIHGHSEEWRKIERFIKDELGFNAIVMKESYSGKQILDKFTDAVIDADCAVAIMSPDDKLANGNFRARQNVLYELGYCKGVLENYYAEEDYDFEPVIVIKEKTIDMREVSDLIGLEVLNYHHNGIETVYHHLGRALQNIYEELGGEE